MLPFANLSGDPEQDYFADGMVEEITTALSRVRWFFVIARNSSFTYKGRAVDVKQVGRELGVRYVLEGSVRKAGERVRITAQLVETETGAHVWADRFDGVIANIFDLQDEITASVVGAIEPQLRDAELVRAARHRPTNPTAYDCFLRGMARYYTESREENDATMGLLRSAIASDPDFAPPYGLAAQCCLYRIAQGWSEDSRSDCRVGIEMAKTGARLGAGDPTVLAMSGHSLGYLSRRVRPIAVVDRTGAGAQSKQYDRPAIWWLGADLRWRSRHGDGVFLARHETRIRSIPSVSSWTRGWPMPASCLAGMRRR